MPAVTGPQQAGLLPSLSSPESQRGKQEPWKRKKGQEEGRDRKLDGDKETGEDWKKRNTGEREEETEPGREEQTTPGKMCPCPSAACSLAKLLSGSQRPASRSAEKDAGELLPPRSGKQSAATSASGLPDLLPHCRAEACGSPARKPCRLP